VLSEDLEPRDAIQVSAERRVPRSLNCTPTASTFLYLMWDKIGESIGGLHIVVVFLELARTVVEFDNPAAHTVYLHRPA